MREQKITNSRLEDLEKDIEKLKKRLKAVILAHNYQRGEVQDIADFVGDSLALSRAAAATDARVIVFCGVHFMAETAAILCPDKVVLIPDEKAGCPMADMIDEESLSEMKSKYPGIPVVCYVNSSAAVKAASDICCTSGNAVAVVESLGCPEVIFVPDKCLGAYVASKMGVKIHLYPGFCPTHHRVLAEEASAMKKQYPEYITMAHPECTEEVLRQVDFIGGTGDMLKFASRSQKTRFLVGTEAGILHRLRKENPGKDFILLSENLICPNMKLTTLEKVLWAMEEMKHRVTVPNDIREKALGAIEKMLQI